MGLDVTTTRRIADVDARAWDALAGADNPFVEHAFLAHLEASGSVGGRSGWAPQHLLVWRVGPAGRQLVGAAPAYLKNHSQGEYIFDFAWAQACERAGIPYYPKLVIAVPFTPATGPRLLAHPSADASGVRRALVTGAQALAERVGAWSCHALFTEPREVADLEAGGWMGRLSHQFHWMNQGYADFDAFLGAMVSKRRKEVRRERRQAASLGLELAVERGEGLSDDDLEALRLCYLSTISEHWAIPYLSEAWFAGLRDALGHRAVVATARREGRIVAASLAFVKGSNLYGRYWGHLEPVPALHFELCYYQFIAWAIDNGLARFEAGAQGHHKLARGFMPQPCHSAHWIRHPGLKRAVSDFLVEEADAVRAQMDALAASGPFRCGSGP